MQQVRNGVNGLKQAQGLFVALLLALLVGGGSAATAETRGAAFTQIDPGKASAAPRSATRSSDQSDDDAALPAFPSDPAALPTSTWPGGATAISAAFPLKPAAPLAYQARAPPARAL
ncbi:MAG: hypothetical protein ACK4SZ_15635 [Allosphingosinicella sp.]|uniref:hypothetical protein n=1 Tax=Allosphingosinicella sp. TaxID=2823234 RepID=UPI00394F4803